MADYVYTDETDAPLFKVVRKPGKKFPQYRWEDGKWKSRLNGTRRVLYHLPDVLAAAERHDAVYLVEGEKDADRLIALGHTATTNPGGAGKWRDDYSASLVGASVELIWDNDEPDPKTGKLAGQDHALAVAASLRGAGVPVTMYRAATGKDVSDHLEAGHTLDELEEEDPSPTPPRTAPVAANGLPEPHTGTVPAALQLAHDRLAEHAAQRGLPAPRPWSDGVGWEACCPAHDDRSPSLSIGQGDQVAIVATCHTGCELSAIIAALRMEAKQFSAKPDDNIKDSSGLIVRDADMERAEPFKWLWEQRILMSYLNLIAGEEGIGKGNLAAWVAARLTRGDLPGSLVGKPRRFLLVGDEDSWDHVWTPRLEVAGADLALCTHIVRGTTGVFNVREAGDIAALTAYITGNAVALTYFDQLLDNLGVTNNWKDKDVRDALAPLRTCAADTETAMMMSLHPNKRTGSFRERLSGTPAFNALSRSSMVVAEHPLDSTRVVMVRAKGNYSEEPPAFGFRIQKAATKGKKNKGKRQDIMTSRIVDTGDDREVTREDIYGKRRQADSDTTVCGRLIRELLADKQEHDAGEIIKRLEAEGYSHNVVQRASSGLRLKRRKSGFAGGWIWQLP